MDRPRVLIVGAGPTGLVLALWLAKGGVPLRIIDRKPGPGEGSRAMVVQARSLEFYRQLGIADQVVAAGFELDRVHLRNERRVIAQVRLGEVGKGESPYPFALSFPQDDHERLLIECLQASGQAVEWNTEFVGLSQQEGCVCATLRKLGEAPSEETWEGGYLCGCDGASSAVRHATSAGFPGGTYDQLFYVADAEAQGDWSQREIHGYIGAKSFCLAFPVRQPGMFRFIGLVPESLRERDDVGFDELQGDIEQLSGARVSRLNWFSTYRVHHRVADRFQSGRVFLAGDAGHVHSPVGGQGMNTGIGDAVNLAWKLAAVLKHQATESVLDSYEAERVPFAQSLVATTDRVFEAVVGRGLLARSIRTIFAPRILPFLLRFEAARKFQFRLVSQTRIHYRGSPLSDGSAGRLHAGDRLPWVEGIDNFQPLASLDWQIHIYGAASADVRQFAASTNLPLHEWSYTAEARQADLIKNAFYLIRPDGHIGFARETPDFEALRLYLARFGIGGRHAVFAASRR